MSDFLSFNTFISIPVLITFYYLGAVVMPLSLWFFTRWIMKKFSLIKNIQEVGRAFVWRSLSVKQKILFILLFNFLFVFMELMWRVMFEYIIAYMQMRDALVS